MKKSFKVTYEVSKYAIVQAENESDAIDLVMSGEVETQEDEITGEAIAYPISE